MKKLLLILFISLGFITSVSANSIEGGFGYKLGQSVPSAKLTCKWEYEKKTLFKPRYGEYKLELEYMDSHLFSLASNEIYAYKKKALEESSNYDV